MWNCHGGSSHSSAAVASFRSPTKLIRDVDIFVKTRIGKISTLAKHLVRLTTSKNQDKSDIPLEQQQMFISVESKDGRTLPDGKIHNRAHSPCGVSLVKTPNVKPMTSAQHPTSVTPSGTGLGWNQDEALPRFTRSAKRFSFAGGSS